MRRHLASFLSQFTARRFIIRAATLAAILVTALSLTPRSVAGAPGPAWQVLTSTHPTPLFYEASGAAVGGRGNVFIADLGDHRVEKLSPAGHVVAVWGTDAPGPLRFAGPYGIAVDRAGNVYLADDGIVRLSSSGRFLGRWAAGPLAHPAAVAVDAAGTVYALALHRNAESGSIDDIQVARVSPRGQVLSVWSFPEKDIPYNLVHRVTMALNPAGNAVLSIYGEKYCHSCDGTYYLLQTLSPAGKVATSWSAPVGGSGLAVDAQGDVYLTAPGKVYKLGPDGRPLGVWGTAGCGPLQFGSELQVVVGASATVFVTDSQPAAVDVTSHIPSALRDGVLHALTPDGQAAAFFGRCPVSPSMLFGQANGIAVGPRGAIYVSDISYGKLDRLAPNGVPTGTFGPDGHTSFVATDSHGNVYTDVVERQALHQYAPNGQLLRSVETGPLQDVAIDSQGNVYALSVFGSVIVYRPTFAVARHWWLSGYSPHQGGLNPNAIALGGGAVYVADTRYNRVQKFSASGRLLGIWGGRTGVRFWRPYGIGVGLRGHVFVLDTGNNRVVELDGNGRVLAIWGRQGQAPGQFNQPMGLALDRRGNVYVADTRNDRIQKLVTGGHG